MMTRITACDQLSFLWRTPFSGGVLLFVLLTPVLVSQETTPVVPGENRLFPLHTALKNSTIAAHNPNDPVLYNDRQSTAELLRFRFMLEDTLSDDLTYNLAYEHSLQWQSTGSMGGNQRLLPSSAEAPYRIHQWDWIISEKPGHFIHEHEIDRSALSYNQPWGRATLGRQAIGLGRGIIFSAIDLFSPFSPLEVDREWRRGVDALRIEKTLTDTSSIEWISAIGASRDKSAHILRLRGFWDMIDAEFLLGERADDELVGTALSANVADAEAHIECALFKTPERQLHDGLWGNSHLVGKAVIGSSYTIAVRDGITILCEYHYSGFGLKGISELPTLMATPAYQSHYLRGDIQILGRHALALQVTAPFQEQWIAGLLLIGSPQDGSGIASPTLSWDYSDRASLSLSLMIPWGDEPENGQLKSEYGGSPTSLFLQLNYHF